MSTAGSVAWRLPDSKLTGVYNHYDSYPTELGIEVFEEVRNRGISVLATQLASYGDWRQVASNSICQYCGKVTGQPHSIGLTTTGFGSMGRAAYIAMRCQQSTGRPDLRLVYEREIAALDEIVANLAQTGWPDPEAKQHKHGNGAVDQFDPFDGPLAVEWVYVLRPDTRLIEVWVSTLYTTAAAKTWKRWSQQKISYNSGASFTHVYVTDVGLNTDPDWERIEQQGRTIRSDAAQTRAA